MSNTEKTRVRRHIAARKSARIQRRKTAGNYKKKAATRRHQNIMKRGLKMGF